MTFIRRRAVLALAAAALANLPTAWADDTCHGYSIGTAKDRVLIHLMGSLPMHLASGECGTSSPDSSGQMTSECVYTDADGDQWTSRNKWSGQATEGTWCNTVGTGKYRDRMGGCGWWKVLRRGPLSSWEFGGQCLHKSGG